MSATSKPLVVITGVSGYLGSHVCLQFLKDGSYRVRGTVRSTSNEAKIKPLKESFGKYFDELELFEADLNIEQSIVDACENATYLVHTASPFNFNGSCVGPAVNGTNAAMKACAKHGIKRVAITSSCAAVMACADEDKPDKSKGEKMDESFWSNPDRKQGLNDYFESKTRAELAAWNFQKEHCPDLEIVTINPTFIQGPSLLGGNGFSENWIKEIMEGQQEKIPAGDKAFVDVRDCAIAHLKAIKLPEAANKRFILYNSRISFQEVYETLATFNSSGGAKVPTEVEEGEGSTDFDLVDNSRSRNVLGIDYIPTRQTFLDAGAAFLASKKK